MYYPINVDIREKDCLVVGGGQIASRKAESLLNAGGKVRLVSPKVTDEIEQWASVGKIQLALRPFEPADLEGCFLVIGATNVPAVHDAIYQLCHEKNILVNIVDVPNRCNFIFPAVIRRGNFMLAISTNGASPGFSKKIRRELEVEFGEEYGTFLNWMSDARNSVIEKISVEADRKKVFESLIYSQVFDLLKEGKKDEAREEFDRILKEHV